MIDEDQFFLIQEMIWINVYYFITLKWISVEGIKINLVLSLYIYVGTFSRKDQCIAQIDGLVEKISLHFVPVVVYVLVIVIFFRGVIVIFINKKKTKQIY